jgi:hypothetical protein
MDSRSRGMRARRHRHHGFESTEIGRKVKTHKRDCQRCGHSFKTNRIVPYCPACFSRSGENGGAADQRASGPPLVLADDVKRYAQRESPTRTGGTR